MEGREAPPNLSALRMLGAEDAAAQAQYRELRQANAAQMERGALLMQLVLACRLLREGRQNIATVGTNVGFQDTSTFLRWFRRQMGCTLTRYYVEQSGKTAREMPALRGRANYVAAAA